MTLPPRTSATDGMKTVISSCYWQWYSPLSNNCKPFALQIGFYWFFCLNGSTCTLEEWHVGSLHGTLPVITHLLLPAYQRPPVKYAGAMAALAEASMRSMYLNLNQCHNFTPMAIFWDVRPLWARNLPVPERVGLLPQAGDWRDQVIQLPAALQSGNAAVIMGSMGKTLPLLMTTISKAFVFILYRGYMHPFYLTG